MLNKQPNSNHRNPFAQTCWFMNDHHAWLCVPRELLKRFNLESKVSTFSYQTIHPDGTPIVFLEEDCDANLIIHSIGLELFKNAHDKGWIKDHKIPNSFFTARCEGYRN